MSIPEWTSKGLNVPRVRAYDLVSNNERKEVIQCLVQSAVTSLGSPIRLSPHGGRLSDRASENNIGARRDSSPRLFAAPGGCGQPYQRSWPSQHMMFTLTDRAASMAVRHERQSLNRHHHRALA
jgi:hypothetical protein